MAKVVIGATVRTDTKDSVKSVGNIRTALREAREELHRMQAEFGDFSPQALDAARNMANLKDQIGDANDLVEAFNPDRKFAAIGLAVNGLTGGFVALQGVMGLVGSESEDVAKTLLKVQSAMALAQGLDQIRAASNAYKQLGVILANNVANAFKTVRSAIISTGIGALVVLVGILIANFDKLKAAISGVSVEEERSLEISKERVALEEKKLEDLENQDNILKLQGKSEREILKLKTDQLTATIAIKEEELETQKRIVKAQFEAEARNKKILHGIIGAITIPLQLIINTVTSIANFLGADWNFSLADSISGLIFDPNETKEEGKATIKEVEDALTELKNRKAGYQLQIQDIDKKAADKASEARKKELEELKKHQEEAFKLNQQLEKENEIEGAGNQKDKDLLRLFDEFKEKRAILEKGGQDLIALEVWYQRQRAAIIDTFTAAERKKALEELEAKKKREKEANDAIIAENQRRVDGIVQAIGTVTTDEARNVEERRSLLADSEATLLAQTQWTEEQRTAIRRAFSQANIAIDEQETAARKQFYSDIGSASGALADLIGKQTAVGKGLAIAQATINTWQGATEVLKAKSVLPEPMATISKVVNFAAIVATGLKAVKSILSVKVPGSGGGSAPSLSTSAPLQPQLQTQNTQLNQSTINALGNQAVRAFVVESDATTNQERIRRINRAARLG
jgi:hypothetical protein